MDDINKEILETIFDAMQSGSASESTIDEIIDECFVLMGTSESNGISRDINNPNIFNRVLQLASKQRNNGNLCVNLNIDWSKVNVDTSKPPNVYVFSIFCKDPFPMILPPTPATTAANIPITPGPPVAQNNAETPTRLATPHPDMVAAITLQTQISQQNQQIISAMQANKFMSKGHINPFIPMNFPQQVCACYKLNMEQYKYHTKHDLTHFLDITSTPPVECKYHPYPTSLSTDFVTIDGTYFVLIDLGPQSEKNFRNTVNKFTGSSTYEFFNWYTCFTSHCSRFGKYCHPYPCFQPT